MSQPLVSVITPTMNPGPRLARCLRSVTDQTYTHVEHIVIDGGSTDGSLEILATKPNVTWISEPDEGQSDAINKGFAMAKGDYLGWLNADDYLVPQAVERTVTAFAENPQAGWSVGDVIVRGPADAQLERPASIDKEASWRARNLAAQPGSFTARWALDKVGGLDPSFHLMMDLDLWLRLLAEGIRHVYIPEVLAVFELHEDSKSGSISHAEFLLEDGKARAKVGRLEEAAFAFGRAMAWSDASEPYEWLQGRLGPDLSGLRKELISSGLRTERLVLGAKGSTLSALRVLAPTLWLSGLSRSRVLHAAGRELSRAHRRRAASRFLRQMGLGEG